MKSTSLLFAVLFSLLIAGTSGDVAAQTVIEGVVKERISGQAAAVYVLVRPPGNSIMAIAYAATDENGRYRIIFNSALDSLDLCLNGIGLESVVSRIPNRSDCYDFKINRQAFRLNEVEIKAAKMIRKGPDTIVYNVAAFQDKTDLVVEDVLKKMPGIQVQDNGMILYKGQPVNFHIEGMDLLKGRYGIATKNISPRHIATVEILENHQVIKALEGLMPSDRTTLNLRLKESSKGVFIASLAAGGGYDKKGLYEGECAGMFFGKKSQHILTAKGNNTGHDLRYELMDHNNNASGLNPVLSEPALASVPSIAQRYHYFNHSEALSFNHLVKTDKELIIGVNALYLHDRENRESEAATQWMMPDSTLNVIEELLQNTLFTHKMEADLSFKKNTSRYYLSNQNHFGGLFNDIAAMANNLGQSYSLRSFQASSTFYFTHRTGETSGYNLDLQLRYEQKPYRLRVDSASGVAAENPYAGAVQQVFSDGFQADANITFFRKLKLASVTLSPLVRATYRFNRLESDLELPLMPVEISFITTNRLKMNRFYFAPVLWFNYLSSHWEASLYIPVAYHFTGLFNWKTKDLARHRIVVEPELRFRYKVSASTELRFEYTFVFENPSFASLYEGAILANYRSLSLYRADLTEGIRHNFRFQTDYKDIFHMFFVHFSLGYDLGQPRILYGMDFSGIYSTTVTRKTDRLWHDVYGNLEVEKNFYKMETAIRLSFGADYFQKPFLMQEQISTGYGQSYQAGLEVSFYPLRFLCFAYTGNLMYMLLKQEEGEGMRPLFSVSNQLALSFRLPHDIRISLGGNHYHNGAVAVKNTDFMLFDAGLEYTYKKFRWSLACNNLLSTRTYVYSSLSTVGGFCTRYRIRPRTFFLKMAVRF
ncbi:MAG: hypothetical protein K2L50_05965 [Bacteroidales bacterium]|nr:hypothetical protein [Bacteroidales bacterium]